MAKLEEAICRRRSRPKGFQLVCGTSVCFTRLATLRVPVISGNPEVAQFPITIAKTALP
jgi:hypothetical protein